MTGRRVLPIDWVLAAVLATAGLLPLASTFRGVEWLVVSLSSIVITVALVAWLSRATWTMIAAPLVLALVYVVIAMPITSPRPGMRAMVPTDDTFGLVMRATARCWGQLIGTLPLVDSSGPPLLVPLALGMLGAAGAAALVATTRHPAAPAVPPLVTLALAMALGRGDLSQVPVGLVFAVVALFWVAHRGARDDHGRTLVARHQLVGMVVMLLVAGLGGSALAAGLGSSIEPRVLRETHALGMDTGGIPTLLTGFRRYRPPAPGAVDNVVDKRLITVTGGPPLLRMRFAVLDTYDGVTWRPTPDRSPDDSAARYLKVGTELDNPAEGELAQVRVTVHDGWRSNWVPTAGALQEISFAFQRGRPNRRLELRYNLATESALLPTFLKGGDDYYFESRLTDDELTDDLGVGPDLDPDLVERATFVGPVADRYLQRYQEPLTALLALARRLKDEGRYSDGARGFEVKFRDGHGVERLGPLFLFAPQIVGNDEQYAALMALFATRLGIPARVVVGAVTPESGHITGRDVHAWIEVQVADGSWRALPSHRFVPTRPPDPEPDEREQQPDGGVLLPQNPNQQQQPQQPQTQNKPQQRFPKPLPVLPEDDWWDDWPWLLLLLPLMVPAVKLVRRQRRRGADRPADAIAAGWTELLDRGRDLGVPALAGTRTRQAAALGQGEELARRADDHVFGPSEPSADDAAAFWELVVREAGELAGTRPRWRRVLAWLSPVSLLPPGGTRRED